MNEAREIELNRLLMNSYGNFWFVFVVVVVGNPLYLFFEVTLFSKHIIVNFGSVGV